MRALPIIALLLLTTPAAGQNAIQRRCSEQADSLNLHGDARRDFRSKCKEKYGLTKGGKDGVSIGMTAQQVLESSWGRPRVRNQTATSSHNHEQWVYEGGQYIYLDDGIVTSIQTAR